MNLLQKIFSFGDPNFTQSTKINPFSENGKKRISEILVEQAKFNFEYGQEELRNALDIARNPHNPRRYELLVLLGEIYRKDLHLQSQIRTANNSVKSQSWAIVNKKTKEIKKEQTELLQKKWFENVMDDFLNAEYWATSLTELGLLQMDPDLKQWVFKDTKLIPREHVCPEKGLLLINPYDTDGFPYREAPYNTWLIEAGNPNEYGLLVSCAIASIFKSYSISDWSRSSEKFSDPILAIMTDQDDMKELKKKAEFAKNFGKNSWGIFDKSLDEIQLLERKNGGQAHLIYKDLLAFVNDENSKGINGQVATADQKSFVGAAQVQQDILTDYTTERQRSLMYHINDVVIPKLLEVNGGDTAYSSLKDCAWMPLKFMRELKTPDQIAEEEAQKQQQNLNDRGSNGKKQASLP